MRKMKIEAIAQRARSAKKYFGRMNAPTASSFVQGPCGDFMEFYLVIEEGNITDIKYYTEGCGATRACGNAVAAMVFGKSVDKAMGVSAGAVIAGLRVLPDSHRHCAILAVSAFYRAMAGYFLKP